MDALRRQKSPDGARVGDPYSPSTSPTVLTKNNNWAGYKWPALFLPEQAGDTNVAAKVDGFGPSLGRRQF
jgi:hypothetical protein